MSTSQNKAIVERLLNEVMNKRQMSLIPELLAPGFQHRSFPTPVSGPEGFREVLLQFLEGFPDIHLTVEHVIAEGDLVASSGYWTGTNEGSFMGLPATGGKVRIPFVDFWQFENGKVIANWVQMDNVMLMQQLGHMPQPA